jgi:hypothetical protein
MYLFHRVTKIEQILYQFLNQRLLFFPKIIISFWFPIFSRFLLFRDSELFRFCYNAVLTPAKNKKIIKAKTEKICLWLS